ncbi:hypothetical protein B0O99DRAFT_691151 [Bisporella sp. PMI_857]|nr:hypothetical protein B0O99DRAFT_691151 [Bisporella sp. PMI_857]
MLSFNITVTGHSVITHPAELAVLSLSISDTGKTHTDASNSVKKSVGIIEALLGDKSKTGIDGGIVSWKKQTTPTIGHENRGSMSMSKSLPRVSAGFEITFRDFVLLGSWTASISATPNVNIRSITWKLTNATQKTLETKGRKNCVEDALNKAQDFAEAFGAWREAVKPVELQDSDVTTSASAENGNRGLGRIDSYGKSWESGDTIVFVDEEIRLKSSINVKFIVNGI